MMCAQGRLVKAALLAVVLGASGGTAFADFAGTTSGFFSSGSSNLGTNVLGLQFNGGSFGPSGSPVTLGSFSFTNPPFWPQTLDPYDFTLNVNFTKPLGGSGTFSADIKGVVAFGLGVAFINFDPNTQHITYPISGGGSDSFYLTLNDIVVASGATAYVVGTINPNPEPSSIILISTVMGGAFLLFRRANKRVV